MTISPVFHLFKCFALAVVYTLFSGWDWGRLLMATPLIILWSGIGLYVDAIEDSGLSLRLKWRRLFQRDGWEAGYGLGAMFFWAFTLALFLPVFCYVSGTIFTILGYEGVGQTFYYHQNLSPLWLFAIILLGSSVKALYHRVRDDKRSRGFV